MSEDADVNKRMSKMIDDCLSISAPKGKDLTAELKKEKKKECRGGDSNTGCHGHNVKS